MSPTENCSLRSFLASAEAKHHPYPGRFDVKSQKRQELGSLRLCDIHSRLVNNWSFISSVRDLLHHEVYQKLSAHLHAMLAPVSERAVRFGSEPSNVVDTHNATICKDASTIISAVNGH